MSKIEEITEILVNEINNFNKDVTKLEGISKKLETTKIAVDLTAFKSILESHEQKMSLILNSQEQILNRFESLLKKAKIYPNWAVVVFIISILTSFGAIFYAYTVNKDSETIENEAYKKGIDSNGKYLNEFCGSNSNTK